MKHLANCSLDEFMPQALKFRAPFMEWIEKIGAREIRHKYREVFNTAESDNDKISALNAMFGDIEVAAFEKAPELTKELLCLATFTDEKDFDAVPVTEYIGAAFEIYGNRTIRDFFTQLLAPMMIRSSKG